MLGSKTVCSVSLRVSLPFVAEIAVPFIVRIFKMSRSYSYFRHCNNLKLSYFEHMKQSCSFGVEFLAASYRAFVHALIPSLYETSSTRTVKKLHKRIAHEQKRFR